MKGHLFVVTNPSEDFSCNSILLLGEPFSLGRFGVCLNVEDEYSQEVKFFIW